MTMRYFPARFLVAILTFLVAFHFSFAAENVKLPYAAGERFIVSNGYNTPPTHIKKDAYAIDFTQNGCDAYGKSAVAAFSGTAWVVDETGYNGGYGTELLILASGNVVARYAHLIPGSIPVNQGDAIPQGTIIGEIGNTGLVAGAACAEHPGTHIHFAMDTENADGSFSAKDPEPISGYVGITAERQYVSDNALAATKGNLASLLEILRNLLGGGTAIVNSSDPVAIATPASSGVQSSSVSGSQQAEQATIAAPSSSVAAINLAPVISSSSAADVLSPRSQSIASPVPTSVAQATTSMANVSSGGGSSPAGGGASVSPASPITIGISGAAPSSPISASVSSSLSSSDDPSDDTVLGCSTITP